MPQETVLLEICLREERPANRRLLIYYRDVMSTIIISSTSPTTAAAQTIFTFFPLYPSVHITCRPFCQYCQFTGCT